MCLSGNSSWSDRRRRAMRVMLTVSAAKRQVGRICDEKMKRRNPSRAARRAEWVGKLHLRLISDWLMVTLGALPSVGGSPPNPYGSATNLPQPSYPNMSCRRCNPQKGATFRHSPVRASGRPSKPLQHVRRPSLCARFEQSFLSGR